jgi:hypothetical protein
MEISQTNQNLYQSLNSYQRVLEPKDPTIQPMPLPETPTPELSDEQKEAIVDYKKQKEAEEQEQKDDLRKYYVASTGIKSKQTQFEIYMSEMTNSDVEISNDVNIIENLREIQKQNDAIEGYATYKELQKHLQDSMLI